jgi:hypothetical protein
MRGVADRRLLAVRSWAMRTFLIGVLLLGALLSGLLGGSIFGQAMSAVHEIEALICFLICAVCVAGLAVSLGVERLIKGEPTKAPAKGGQ